ncbi:hypothetical protein [Bacteroides sp.]|uniref:hypothetical protein n=1 Tax=Bacteroides sp. TaxID=29523 RepID=UPI002639EAD7|nr:hypothetical protein [Bacteroides sp.]MDD3039550.1 hypothetical protein [Bacteroides sp.]
MGKQSGVLCGVRTVKRGDKAVDAMQDFKSAANAIQREMAQDRPKVTFVKGRKENWIPPAYVQENMEILQRQLLAKKPKKSPKLMDRKERQKRRQAFEAKQREMSQ